MPRRSDRESITLRPKSHPINWSLLFSAGENPFPLRLEHIKPNVRGPAGDGVAGQRYGVVDEEGVIGKIPYRKAGANSRRMKNTDVEIIRKEIKELIDGLIRGCEALDPEAAFGIFSDSPDFLMMGTDGSVVDCPTYLKNNVDYLQTCDQFRLTTNHEEIRIIDPAVTVFAWSYTAEAFLKTGERDIFDNAGASFVFHKVNGNWKVVYYHESSSPPRRVMP
jgi:hypothetical protein